MVGLANHTWVEREGRAECTSGGRVVGWVRPEWWDSRLTGLYAASWLDSLGRVDGAEHLGSEAEARALVERRAGTASNW